MAYDFVNLQDASIKYYPQGDRTQKATMTLSGINGDASITAGITFGAIGDLLAIGGVSAIYDPTDSYRTLEQSVVEGA